MLALRRAARLAFCQWRGILHDPRPGTEAVWKTQIRLSSRLGRAEATQWAEFTTWMRDSNGVAGDRKRRGRPETPGGKRRTSFGGGFVIQLEFG